MSSLGARDLSERPAHDHDAGLSSSAPRTCRSSGGDGVNMCAGSCERYDRYYRYYVIIPHPAVMVMVKKVPMAAKIG